MTNPTPKRGRGRPKGSRNKGAAASEGPKVGGAPQGNNYPEGAGRDLSPAAAPSTTRAGLEADRDRLLKSIASNAERECLSCHRGGDPKVEASIQTALNAVNRMLLQISGETAPTDTNMIRSPQFGRFMALLCDCLSKKHPKAWLDVQELAAAEAR